MFFKIKLCRFTFLQYAIENSITYRVYVTGPRGFEPRTFGSADHNDVRELLPTEVGSFQCLAGVLRLQPHLLVLAGLTAPLFHASR